MIKLTQRQHVVLKSIKRSILEFEHRRSPFIREAQPTYRVALYKSVIDHLNALERKGFIERTPNERRSIRLVGGTSASSVPESATIPPEAVHVPVPV